MNGNYAKNEGIALELLSMDEIRSAPLIGGEEEGEDRSFVEEAAEINQIVKRVVDSEGSHAESVFDRWKQIVRGMKI